MVDLDNLTVINQNDEQTNTDEIAKEIVGHLFDPDNLSQNTRIKPEQVAVMAKCEAYADYFKVPFLKTFVNKIKENQISIMGLGRRELVQMVQKRSDDPSLLAPTKRGIF